MFERRPIPFRWIFPLGQLVLCWFVTAVVYSLPPLRWLYFHAVVQIIRGLNLPGGLLQLPITILRADKTDWHPSGVESSLWCAISWPVLALVFWWMAGRAVEALRTLGGGQIMPRVTLVEAIVGGVLMSFGLVLVVGLTIGEGRQVYTDRSTGLLAAAGGLWALLGGLTVVARFRQWRLRRMLTRSNPISRGPSDPGVCEFSPDLTRALAFSFSSCYSSPCFLAPKSSVPSAPLPASLAAPQPAPSSCV